MSNFAHQMQINKFLPRFVFLFSIGILLSLKSFAFLFCEHKYIGDQAFIRFLGSDANKIKLWKDILQSPDAQYPFQSVMYLPHSSSHYITYGDLTGLAGDNALQPVNLFYQLLQLDASQWFGNARAFEKAKSDSTLLKILKPHLKAISRGQLESKDISLQMAQRDFGFLAVEDQSHFYDFEKTTIADELSVALDKYIVVPDGKKSSFLEIFSTQKFIRIKTINNQTVMQFNIAQVDSFFRNLSAENIASKYCVLHTMAQQLADLAGINYAKNNNTLTPEGRLLMRLSLVFNANADHFLQDAFAAGHLVVKRSKHDKFNNKGTHDYYNRVGLQVDNSEVQPWISYGDGYLDTTQINYQKVLDAGVASLNDLWNRFYLHTRNPALPDFFTDLHDKSEKQVVAIFMRQFYGMRLIPFPAESGIVTFAHSRNGYFVGGTVSAPSLIYHLPDVDFHFGIGYNIKNGRNKSAIKRESDVWAAASVAVGYYNSFNQDIGKAINPMFRINIPEFNFFNWISVEPLSIKCVYLSQQKRMIAIWNPSIGIERKRIDKNWSWAFKAYYQRLTPTIGRENKIYPAFKLRYYL